MKVLLTIVLSLITSNAFSFSLNNTVGAAFSKNTVPVNIADNCTNLGVSSAELLSMVSDAGTMYWNTVSTSRLRITAGSVVSVDSKFYTDKVCTTNSGSCEPNTDLTVASDILITCNGDTTDNFPNAQKTVLAITIPNNISDRTINGALIAINDRSDNIFQDQSRAKMVSVLAHEIGHAVGLGHSPVGDSLMYYTLVPVRDRLGWDDIDGITYLYPREQPFGCGTIEDINNSGKGAPLLFVLLMPFLLIQLLKLRDRFSHSFS
ncbi:MAG: matrixin family metalloprotease [Bacteriovoracaceae bacterium]|nr:matrixin family metalloprotease [Bacteriovoracaceae bacterium]